MSMSMTKCFGVMAISAALCSGCDATGADSETANRLQKGGLWQPNGPDLVHSAIDGALTQGIRLSRNRPIYLTNEKGASQYAITSTTYTDSTATTYPVSAIAFDQGWMQVSYNNGAIVKHEDVRGLAFSWNAPEPGKTTNVTYTMTVKDVLPPKNGATEYGLHYLTYSYLRTDGTRSAEQSLCVDSEGNAEPAVPVRGRYWDITSGNYVVDETIAHLACQSAAVAGCMDYGYNPWLNLSESTTQNGVPYTANMWAIHQTCTRLKRGDYCGTGKAHTMSGTLIHVFDWMVPPINGSGAANLKQLEAVWNETGVSCVIPANLRHKELVADDPACYDKLYNHTPLCVPERLGRDILGDIVEDPSN